MNFKTHKIGLIEIIDNDLSYYRDEILFDSLGRGQTLFSYDVGFSVAKELGDEWRFPSLNEIRYLKTFFDLRVLNFDRGSGYWLHESFDDENVFFHGVAYLHNLSYGGVPKGEKFSARFVRSI
jgi:hypothetical protein